MPLLFWLPALVLCAFAAPHSAQEPAQDAREHYDVQSYRLDLRVDPATRRLTGVGYMQVRVVATSLDAVQLDLAQDLEVLATREIPGSLPDSFEGPSSPLGRRVEFLREASSVVVRLERTYGEGEVVSVGVEYGGHPTAVDSFTGFHWSETEAGQPWISTSVQGIGASSFWPCKDSFFHPEDKPDTLAVNLTVPRGLLAVSNGRLAGRTPRDEEWETFHWRHPYPCETYAVTINVGPYLMVERPLELAGHVRPVPFAYWVLPRDAEKARLQFEEVPELLELYAEHFGPWPFPEAKVGIVQTSFWGMEHSTAIAYGSSFPRWCGQNERPDPWAHRNRLFDYVLVHELAHEWWGNAVSATDWGHFWIHEGFATYGEALVVEARHGRERADEFFERMRNFVSAKSQLYRGAGPSSEEAYGGVIYVKGAWLLHTLRHYLDDDEAWWRALREFNQRFRLGNADTEDFRAVLEEITGRSWERFFQEWFYGTGYPELSGEIRVDGEALVVDIDNPVRYETSFHVPLDVGWYEGERFVERRLSLVPGDNHVRISCEGTPTGVEVLNLHRVLGKHAVRVVL